MNEPITRIDDITVAPGCRDQFVELLGSRYVPPARERGLEMVELALAPPVEDADREGDVVVTWRLDDVASFWRARRAAMTDGRVAAFWADTAHLIVRRTRRFAQGAVAPRDLEGDDPGRPLAPSAHAHVIVLLDLADGAVPTPATRRGIRASRLGRHLPGSVGTCDASWELDVEPASDLDLGALRDGITVVDAVLLGDLLGGGVRVPELATGIKRTLLLRVNEDAPGATVEEFERDLLGMPRHIPAIRNWRLSRVASSRHGWTHAWEQEYATLSGLRDDYMNSPYHWGLVDGWFDAEDPRCIVAPELMHLFYEIDSSVLVSGDSR